MHYAGTGKYTFAGKRNDWHTHPKGVASRRPTRGEKRVEANIELPVGRIWVIGPSLPNYALWINTVFCKSVQYSRCANLIEFKPLEDQTRLRHRFQNCRPSFNRQITQFNRVVKASERHITVEFSWCVG